MLFLDKFQKEIRLTDSMIYIKRADNKYGHGYSRAIPYSSVKQIIYRDPTFLNYGFFSLITIAGGVWAIDSGRLSSAVDDETTFMFEKRDVPQVKKFISSIEERRACAENQRTSLSEFWGMTYKVEKGSTATLLPEGIKYDRCDKTYTLPYSEILKIEFEPKKYESAEIVIMRKGLDGKLRLQQYKKTGDVSADDYKYCLNVYEVEKTWASHFFKALNIVLDNRHLIPYSPYLKTNTHNSSFEQMSGYDFENFCAELLRKNGFYDIDVTPKSGDQGVDILATKDGVKYAIQCKCYSSKVGNTSVQEVYAGKNFYNCHVGVVMTNSEFTPSAIELSNKTGVLLWDRVKLKNMM